MMREDREHSHRDGMGNDRLHGVRVSGKSAQQDQSDTGRRGLPMSRNGHTAEMQWRSPEFLVVIAHNSGTFTDVVPAVTGNLVSVTD
jgi:hypothetical protein